MSDFIVVSAFLVFFQWFFDILAFLLNFFLSYFTLA